MVTHDPEEAMIMADRIASDAGWRHSSRGGAQRALPRAKKRFLRDIHR